MQPERPLPEFHPPRHAGIALLLGVFTLGPALLGSLFAETTLPYVIVSAGDSVASGEGSPDSPRMYGFNENFNPVPFLPNPDFDTSPLSVNPGFDPSPGTLNTSYDPLPERVNPDFQPIPAPPEEIRLAMELAGIPPLPPQNLNLLEPNPNYSPTLLFENPNFNPNPVRTNPGFDPEPWSSNENPDFQPEPWALEEEAIWKSEDDHRSNWAGPAQAAIELIRRNPGVNIKFEHRAKSGASIAAVGEQIQAALDANSGRIDLLMISAGGNDLHDDGFSGLIKQVLNIIFEEFRRPSTDQQLNAQIERSITALEDKFDQLADIIESGEVGPVFITEYFNFTQDEEGFYTFVEADWLHQSIIVPLNEAIAAAAQKHGWYYVGGIADSFNGHGFQSFTSFELESPFMVNPNFDPIEDYPNPNYDPLPEKVNLNYDPLERIPNLSYNPIESLPNLSYDPLPTKVNPNYNPVPTIPKSGLAGWCYPLAECSRPNPSFDDRLTIPNPAYNPNLTVPNPAYNPNLTVPNPAYNPNLTVPNPEHDPRLTIPNRNYSPDLVVPTPHYLEPWVIGIKYGEPLPETAANHHWVVHLEESLLVQGDIQGTLHPNYWGQAVYRDALLRRIEQVIPQLEPAAGGLPTISKIEPREGSVRIHFTAHGAERLYLESSTHLQIWQEEEATPVITKPGRGYVDVPTSGRTAKFFRLGCR